jgi:hypothetical protein
MLHNDKRRRPEKRLMELMGGWVAPHQFLWAYVAAWRRASDRQTAIGEPARRVIVGAGLDGPRLGGGYPTGGARAARGSAAGCGRGIRQQMTGPWRSAGGKMGESRRDGRQRCSVSSTISAHRHLGCPAGAGPGGRAYGRRSSGTRGRTDPGGARPGRARRLRCELASLETGATGAFGFEARSSHVNRQSPAQPVTGSSTKTGICRSVFRW